jgi:hypothetical protein
MMMSYHIAQIIPRPKESAAANAELSGAAMMLGEKR